MIEYILNDQSIEALGWTLLHSLWQGAAFAIFLVLILIALRSYSAHARYIVSVGVLCAFFLTLSTTFWLQWQEANTTLELTDSFGNQQVVGDPFILNQPVKEGLQSDNEMINTLPANNEVMESSSSGWLKSFRDYYQRHLPLLVTIWLLGVLVLQLRFLGQLAYVQRLKHYGTQLFPTSWSDKIEELEGKLRIQKKVQYLTSIRVESPMVIGWLKPVILMPQQLLTSLTETEIYAVLAHELAHIRREDFIVNLLQTFLCNVFFFHPGVWWMSNRIDDEREHCCDDLAVAATGPATSYAKTLINVSELQLRMQNNPQLAMALSGKNKKRERGGFTDRIRRLFMVNKGAGTFKEGFATAIILITALFLGVAATGSTIQDADSTDASEIITSEINTESKNPNNLELNLDTKVINTIGGENDPNLPMRQVDVDDLPVALPSPPPPPAQPAAPVQLHHLQAQGNLGTAKRPEIIQAMIDGQIEKVQQMVERGTDINTADKNGRTPLHIVAARNHIMHMRVLINLGADLNAQDKAGRTPLMYAAAEGEGDAATLLVSQQANVNIKDADGKRALDWAMSGRHTRLANFLGLITEKRIKAEMNASSNGSASENTEPREVNEEESKQEVVQDIQREDQVIRKDEQQILKNLEKQAEKEVNKAIQKEINKREAFHVAANGTHLRQFNLNTITPAIVQVARNGSITDLQELLHNELDINAADATGQTALMAAASRNRLDIATVLIQNMADVNRASASGLTALHYAALENYDEMALLLLSNNAFVDVAMQYSVTDGKFKKEALVWEYIDATPLLVAVEAGNAKVASVLIDAGADIHYPLTRNEFKLIENRFSYTKGGEVIIDKEFFRNVASQTSDDTWTPYKHALHINKPAIRSLFK